MNKNVSNFTIYTVGWEKNLIENLLLPIHQELKINFIHGIIGTNELTLYLQKSLPKFTFSFLGKSKDEQLPKPNYELLASLENSNIPTIRAMVQGDRILRNRNEDEALGYATLLATQLQLEFIKYKPNLILASFDSLHSAMSLAVAKSLDIPWVAMSFTAIPQNLTGFCSGLTPETLVPIPRKIDANVTEQAKDIIQQVRSRKNEVLAYRPPQSLHDRITKLSKQSINFTRRLTQKKEIGYNRFTWPTAYERTHDILRRMLNRLTLPKQNLLSKPPSENFIFFPLHMQPESSIDTWAPFYQDQITFIKQVALAIPIDLKFIVKLHFSDPDNYTRKQINDLIKLPNLQIANPNAPSFTFLEKSTLVIGIQGTACLEAALLGKPVLIFGDSPYQHFPRTERAKRPDELHGQIYRMVKSPPPTDQEIIDAFSLYLSRYMPGRINDWKRPLEKGSSSPYKDVFENLINHITATRSI